VRLTSLGERLRPHAEALERVLAGVGELVHEARTLGAGRLAMAASTTIALYWLPARLAAFGRDHPAVRVRVLTRNSREAVAALVAGDVDVAFVEGPAEAWRSLPSGLYAAEPVHHDEIVVVVPPGHALASRPRLRLADLAGLAVVGRERGSGTRDVVEAALGAAGVRLDVRLELTEPEAMKRAVLAGTGAAFLSRIAVADEVAAGRLAAVACEPPLRRDFTVLAPRSELASRATRAFVALATAR